MERKKGRRRREEENGRRKWKWRRGRERRMRRLLLPLYERIEGEGNGEELAKSRTQHITKEKQTVWWIPFRSVPLSPPSSPVVFAERRRPAMNERKN